MIFKNFRLIKYLPKYKFITRLFCFYNYLKFHKKFPTKKLMFNDFMYQMRVNGMLEDPLRVFVTDKELAKIYISAIVGEKYVVPNIKILRTVEEIREYNFPENCCIKPTHSCGENIFKKNNDKFNKELIERMLFSDYFLKTREENYRPLIPKVIVEPLLFNTTNINDYKFFCFNGVPKLMQVDVDRFTNHKRNFFDLQWKPLNFAVDWHNTTEKIVKPENLDEMINVARKLSEPFKSFIRIDLYTNGKICKVGEITSSYSGGFAVFLPPESEEILSKILFQ